ncbi:hypothetical protein ACFRKB_31905 [Streptomyces scopuliridis]|uniref:hypothetical protein n=1 Tax=Streptomyces scopuliridis TaxID=452529 RepID=UPI003676FC48
MTETGALDLTRAAYRRRRARGAPVATGADGVTPSDGPPASDDVLVKTDYTTYWSLTPDRLEELRAGLAAALGLRALNSGLLVTGEVGFDLVWRYWKLPTAEQHRMNTHPWPLRSIGNLGEHVYLRAWQRTRPDLTLGMDS